MRCSTPILETSEEDENGFNTSCDITIIEKTDINDVCQAMTDVTVKTEENEKN